MDDVILELQKQIELLKKELEYVKQALKDNGIKPAVQNSLGTGQNFSR